MTVLSEEVIGIYKYPEHDIYKGPAQKAVITFRSVKGLSLLPDWLFEDVIKIKAEITDVTPLRAILKEKKIKESWLDYISSEYTLILYFHDSPAVASIILAIAAVLTAAGFLVLAFNATPETWGSIASIPKAIAEIPKQTSKIFLYIAGGLLGYAALKIYYSRKGI